LLPALLHESQPHHPVWITCKGIGSGGSQHKCCARFGNIAKSRQRFAEFALFARCAVAWLGHDTSICTRLELLMKAHWSDWLMAVTMLVAVAAAALCDTVIEPDLSVLIR
jgi:hypothetical protein